MGESATRVHCRRPELVVRPFGENGQYVVKDPANGAYYHLGDEEQFLLTQLDGRRDVEAIRSAFEKRFGQPLSENDVEAFLDLAQSHGLLETASRPTADPSHGCPLPRLDSLPDHSPVSPSPDNRRSGHQRAPGQPIGSPKTRQSLLAWRIKVFDPDRLFTWLEPKLRFFWTRGFVVVSTACILVAAVLLAMNRHELVGSFAGALHWETVLWAWLALLAVTACHESAHGLTCKHYGGEVHEIGFLMLLLMPCFYCNVSDAWLFREKSKRVWVTLAGGYFELFLWALAVFVWRVALPGGLVHHLAFVVASVCGVQTLFNFNPLVKLDGYYLLSDLAEAPNLQRRAWSYVKARIRWLLWGASPPEPVTRGWLLLGYGSSSLLFSLVFVVLMVAGLTRIVQGPWGLLGVAAAGLLGFLSLRGLLRGVFLGEVRKMILLRHKRTAAWLGLFGAVAQALCLIEIEERAGGAFRVRAITRCELRASVAGFVKEVYFDEGDRVSPGTPVATLEVPDLVSRLAQKRAEAREAQAKLRLLEAGPRSEEVSQQRLRVERMRAWCDLAKNDLAHARQALQEELDRLDEQIAQQRAEFEPAHEAYLRGRALLSKAAITEEQFEEGQRKFQVTKATLAQAQSEKRHREALGTRESIAGVDTETELARREKDLADAESTLTLLEAGTRPEEIDAARAHLAHLEEEAHYLEALQPKLFVSSSVAGVITTARLKEKIGQYLREGELICDVEESASLEAEITITEQEVARVKPGQVVELKARALPFETFSAQVDRVAPAAANGDVQSTVNVYCRLQTVPAELRPGMSGYARVYSGKRPMFEIALDRALRFVRTEFWW
jgi:multidrug efflux pump subunit AcrA (membrane-fusion protein)